MRSRAVAIRIASTLATLGGLYGFSHLAGHLSWRSKDGLPPCEYGFREPLLHRRRYGDPAPRVALHFPARRWHWAKSAFAHDTEMAVSKDTIYLDHNATTPVAPEVLDARLPYLRETFENPSSDHPNGRDAARAVAVARAQVAAMIGADQAEIVFTSGSIDASVAAAAMDPDIALVTNATPPRGSAPSTVAPGHRSARYCSAPDRKAGCGPEPKTWQASSASVRRASWRVVA